LNEPHYRFDALTGQLFFSTRHGETIVGEIDLAIAWTTDEDGNGCLHKHGNSQKVQERVALIRTIDESVKMVVIPWEVIKHPEVGGKIIEEVNLCLAISGRVTKIEAFLKKLSDDHDIEVFPCAAQDNVAGAAP
jgi:hypothetical protein